MPEEGMQTSSSAAVNPGAAVGQAVALTPSFAR